jgi:hypothetical protein
LPGHLGPGRNAKRKNHLKMMEQSGRAFGFTGVRRKPRPGNQEPELDLSHQRTTNEFYLLLRLHWNLQVLDLIDNSLIERVNSATQNFGYRITQSLVHVYVRSDNAAASIRFGFFFVQIIGFLRVA